VSWIRRYAGTAELERRMDYIERNLNRTGADIMSIIAEMRQAIEKNAAETKRIRDAFDRLTGEKLAIAEKLAAMEATDAAEGADLAQLKSEVEKDTADEAQIGRGAGVSMGGMDD
jgi:hypothetical protein